MLMYEISNCLRQNQYNKLWGLFSEASVLKIKGSGFNFHNYFCYVRLI